MSNSLNVPRPFLPLLATLCVAGGSTPLFAQEPTPTTFADVPAPTLSAWNLENALTVEDRTYIYPSAAHKPGEGDDPAEGSVAFITWDLDDGSGRAPGLQAVTDDFASPLNNCIMASGEREFEEGSETMVPKTCSDDPGSSKRFFMELTQADVPVDLVFDVGVRDNRYKGVKDPDDDGGAALEAFREEFGIGRIYRMLQKVINDTDKRIASLEFELGHGVGDAFEPLDFDDDGVGFEMRHFIPRDFLEGRTGAPDRPVWNPDRFANFSPKFFDDGERDRFDPGFLDYEAAGMFPPQDVEPGNQSRYIRSGLSIQDGVIGPITPNYFNIPATQGANASPALTGNIFGYLMPESIAPTFIERHDDGDPETEGDRPMAWWDGAEWRAGRAGLDGDPDTDDGDHFAIFEDSQLEQWAARLLGLEIPGDPDPTRYDSEESDDLSAMNVGYFIHVSETLLDDAGEPERDTITLRLTARSVEEVIGDVPGTEDPQWRLPGNEAPSLASYMPEDDTPVAINDFATTVETTPVDIEVLLNDLYNGAPLDVDDFHDVTVNLESGPENGTATLDDNVFSYTADENFTGSDSFTYTVTVIVEDGDDPVTSNEATVRVRVNPEPVPGAPVAVNDSAVTFMNTPVTIDVLANDQLHGADPADAQVSIVDAPLSGSAQVEGNQIVYTPDEGFLGFERFTYRVTVNGLESNAALVTVKVAESEEDQIPDDPEPPKDPPSILRSGSSSSGCTMAGPGAPFDPLLPSLLALALVSLLRRRSRY